tara:strand:+ start:1078 stop:1563 length:486 start_codon:yes stop_codon:yes gene_type:complete
MGVIKRTTSDDLDFIQLVELLDKDLADRDGEDHGFYAQFNAISHLKHTIVLYIGNKAVACGALKAFDKTAMEIKRMYVMPEFRGKSFATTILKELEHWAAELGYSKCVLETGKRQPEAIALYQKNGYRIIPNYGQYQGIVNSVCFEKDVYSALKTKSNEKN